MNCPTCRRQIPTTKSPILFMCPKCGAQAKLYPRKQLGQGKRCNVSAFSSNTGDLRFRVSLQGVSHQELTQDKEATLAYLEKRYPGYRFPVFEPKNKNSDILSQ